MSHQKFNWPATFLHSGNVLAIDGLSRRMAWNFGTLGTCINLKRLERSAVVERLEQIEPTSCSAAPPLPNALGQRGGGGHRQG